MAIDCSAIQLLGVMVRMSVTQSASILFGTGHETKATSQNIFAKIITTNTVKW